MNQTIGDSIPLSSPKGENLENRLLLERHPNGGWTVKRAASHMGESIETIAAYSDTSDMLHGLARLVGPNT